jgi:hypothetical protein
MRKVLFASAIVLLGLAAAPVQAMSIAPLSGVDPGITLVAGGCGVGFHRGPYGGCIRNGGAVVGAPVVGAPVVVAPGARTYFMYGGRRCYWARPGVRACV